MKWEKVIEEQSIIPASQIAFASGEIQFEENGKYLSCLSAFLAFSDFYATSILSKYYFVLTMSLGHDSRFF